MYCIVYIIIKTCISQAKHKSRNLQYLMASVQFQKPTEQVQPSTNHQKTSTTETCYCKNNNSTVNHNEQHSFSDKVKEMAQSARKMFNHQNPATNNSSTGGGVKTETKKKKVTTKKTEGHDGHCMPKMLDHIKNKKTKKNKDKDEFDSGSSSDSENDKYKKKN
ncbi:hypothetical protein ABFS82_01G063900 [Erythranthe guttata]